MAIMTHPGTCSGHPVAIPETSQGSPKAQRGVQKASLNKWRATSHKAAVISQQLQAAGNKLAKFKDPRKGAGGRRPKALNPATEPFRAKGTAVASEAIRFVGPALPPF